MKYLILGSQGTLGTALMSLFGDLAIGLDRDGCDITNEASVRAAIDSHTPDVVLNAAAYNAVDNCETDEEQKKVAFAINAEGPGNIARVCAEKNIPFVHYSTDYVFSGNANAGYTEDATPDPINVYGESKAAGEKAVQDAGGRYYIIRLSRLIGTQGASSGSKRNFIDTMIWLATDAGKEHLDIVDTEIGSPSYAPDIAAFTKSLLDDNAEAGIYHASNSGECSWYAWANKAFEIKGISIDTAPCGSDKFPRPAKRPAHSTLLNTKRTQLRSWEDALADYLS